MLALIAMPAGAAPAQTASAVAPRPAASTPATPATPASPSRPATAAAGRGAAKPGAAKPVTPAAAGVKPAAGARPGPQAMNDLRIWCQEVTYRLVGPVNERCLRSGVTPGDGRSVNGIPLWSRDIVPTRPALLRVLVIGGIHGDEMTSVNLVFDWLDRALKQPVDRIHWRMVPVVNPDGLLRLPATRVNARGVDLNRNFPTPDWDSSALSYWATRTGKDPRRYPGPKAMSEPETKWVQRQVDIFKPHLIVSVHAPYGVLDFDGPPPPPEKMGSLHLDQVGIYPGSLGNYGGVVRRVPVVTLELRNARQVPETEVAAMWKDLLRWVDQRRDQLAALKPLDDPRAAHLR